jgi:hypothetical protein
VFLVIMAACGNNDAEQYCKEAMTLAGLLEGNDYAEDDLKACVARVKEDLQALDADARHEAETCIACIADTEEEECGCCTTNGNLDILSTDCKSDCDSDGFEEFCAQ